MTVPIPSIDAAVRYDECLSFVARVSMLSKDEIVWLRSRLADLECTSMAASEHKLVTAMKDFTNEVLEELT